MGNVSTATIILVGRWGLLALLLAIWQWGWDLRGVLGWFYDLNAYEPFWLGLVGLTWGFHLTFTISTLGAALPFSCVAQHTGPENALVGAIQSFFIGTRWFIKSMNIYYGTLHFFVTAGILTWMFLKRPGGYLRVRNLLGRDRLDTRWLPARRLILVDQKGAHAFQAFTARDGVGWLQLRKTVSQEHDFSLRGAK